MVISTIVSGPLGMLAQNRASELQASNQSLMLAIYQQAIDWFQQLLLKSAENSAYLDDLATAHFACGYIHADISTRMIIAGPTRGSDFPNRFACVKSYY